MNLLDLAVKVTADDQASDKIAQIGDKVKSGLGTAAKAGVAAVGAAVAAAGAGAIALGKASMDAYATYEQLAGGAQLMFGDAYDFVMEKSQQAYKNVQMSQNEYLQQVNGFAVGLRTALGGNEQAAAELADKIITAEADIVAATGNTAENVQNAFNGVMKGNYTMLDNLGLGINATKEGMQTVIDVVNEHNAAMGKATDYTIENVADVQSALIDYIEMQGMSGYAANEAAETIQGSLAMVSSAWQNLLTEFGKDDADIGARITDLIDSGMAAIDNIAPRIVTIAENIIDAIPVVIEKVSPYLAQIQDRFTKFVSEHQGEFKALGETLWNGIVQALISATQLAFEALATAIGTIIITIPEWGPELLKAAVLLFANILQGIIDTTVTILNGVADLIGQAISTVTGFDGDMLEAAQDLWHKFCDGIANMRQLVVDGFWNLVNGAIENITGFASDAYNVGASIIQGIADGIAAAPDAVINALWGGIGGAIDTVKGWLGIASPSKLFAQFGRYTMEGFAQGIEAEASAPVNAMMEAAKSVYDAASGKIDFAAVGAYGQYSGIQMPYAAHAGDVYNIYVTSREGEDVAVRIRNELHAYNLMRGR